MTDITPSGGKGAAQGATATSTKEIPLILKIYGFLCMADGIVTVPMIFIFGAMVMWALQTNPELIAVGTDPTLPVVLLAISIVVTLGNGIALIIFGHSLLKDRRRNAARWSYVLIATTLVQILLRIMLEGIGTNLIPDAIQLVILLTLSVTVEGGAITAVEVVESSETATIGELALPVYCEEIVETQDVNAIDIASGASNTLRGFQAAVEDALAQA